MERRQIGLKLVLNRMGLAVKVEDFDDRLILQKAMYLAQAAGVDLGYYFRWYLRGPYCPSVAEDGYAVAGELAQNVDGAAGWSLDPASSQVLDRIRSMVSGPDRDELAKKLELLASVHFLINRRQVPDRAPEEIARTLREFGKPFSDDEVRAAIGELVSNDLLHS